MGKGEHLHPPLKLNQKQTPDLKMEVSPWNGKHMALLPLIVCNVMQIDLVWNIYRFYNAPFESINNNSVVTLSEYPWVCKTEIHNLGRT